MTELLQLLAVVMVGRGPQVDCLENEGKWLDRTEGMKLFCRLDTMTRLIIYENNVLFACSDCAFQMSRYP